MLDPAGPDLDRKIAACLSGEVRKRVPSYSTDDRAADRARQSLAEEGLTLELEESGGLWYCACRSGEGGVIRLLATGSGETRALAICRAILNLRRFAPVPRPRESAGPSPRFARRIELERLRREAPRRCADCGINFPIAGRFTSNPLCNVCRWKRGKEAAAKPSLPQETEAP
jgi:hypothetical protein